MGETERIRVLIVDDHPATRTGLGFFVKAFPDLELVGESESGERALADSERLQPDIVLMDVRLPGMSGVDTIRALKGRNANVQIIALTSFNEPELVQQTLRAGALSYLLKDVAAEELARAIRSAHAGQSTLAEEAARALVEAVRGGERAAPNLTEREREVLALVAIGLSNPQIAGELSISPATVKYHVRSILTKFGAANRAEAVAMAWQMGMVSSRPGAPAEGIAVSRPAGRSARRLGNHPNL
jgi:DNA-binding NarL/FixJ family response regulator